MIPTQAITFAARALTPDACETLPAAQAQVRAAKRTQEIAPLLGVTAGVILGLYALKLTR